MSAFGDDLRQLLGNKPFIGFLIHLIDGRMLDVSEPGQLRMSDDAEDEHFSIHSISADGEFEVVELLVEHSILSITVKRKRRQS